MILSFGIRRCLALLALALCVQGLSGGQQGLRVVAKWPGIPRGRVSQMVITNNLAYMAVQDYGLSIFDVTEPTRPTWVGGYLAKGGASGIVIRGNRACLLGTFEFLSLDITDPKKPTVAGRLRGSFYRMQAEGNLLCLQDGGSKLKFLDLSNPDAPLNTGTYSTDGDHLIRKVTLNRGRAFVSCIDLESVSGTGSSSSVLVLDLSDPWRPTEICTWKNVSAPVVHGDQAYLNAGAAGLQVWDISNLSQPVKTATLASVWGDPISLNAGLLYVNGKSNILHVVDAEKIGKLKALGSVRVPGEFRGLAICGDHAYSEGSVVSINLANPAKPRCDASFSFSGTASGIAVSGNRAFLADGDDGLQVLDVTDPSKPKYLGNYDKALNAKYLAFDQDRVLLSGPDGVALVDVHVSSRPRLIGRFQEQRGVNPVNVAMEGSTMLGLFSGRKSLTLLLHQFEVGGDSRLVSIGASDWLVIKTDTPDPLPKEPSGKGKPLPGVAWNEAGRILIRHGIGVLISDMGQLYTLDLKDAKRPKQIGVAEVPRSVNDLAWDGDYLYVANDSRGLSVVDIHTPAQPLFLGSFKLGAYAVGVCADRGWVYVTDDFGFLRIVDARDPAKPRVVGGVSLGGQGRGLTVKGDYLYIANETWGLAVVHCPRDPAGKPLFVNR